MICVFGAIMNVSGGGLTYLLGINKLTTKIYLLTIKYLMMKELKILLLVLTIGFSSPVPASLKCTKAYYPHTFKGGLQTTQKYHPAKIAVEEGDHKYNLKYIIDELNLEKNRDEQFYMKVISSTSGF